MRSPMYLWLLLRIAFRNIFRNPRRSALTAAAVAMGIWSSVSLAALARGVSYGMMDDAIRNLRGHVQFQHPKYRDDPVVENSIEVLSEELKALGSDPVVAHWTWRVRVPAMLQSERESLGVTLVGIDSESEKKVSFLGDVVWSGEFLSGSEDQRILIGKKAAELLQTGLGKRVVIISQDKDGEISDRGFKVAGIFDAELEALETGYVFVERGIAASLLKLGAGFSEASFVLKSSDDIDSFVIKARSALPELDVTSWREREPFIVAIVKVQGKFLVFWFGIVVVAIAFGIINTMLTAVFERIREFSLLQSLGMRPMLIMGQIIFESFFLLIVGVCIGNILGIGTVWMLGEGLDLSSFAAGTEHIGAKSIIIPRILLGDWCKANLMMFALCLVASLYPALMATLYDPAYGMRMN